MAFIPTKNQVSGLQGPEFHLSTTLHCVLNAMCLNEAEWKFAIEVKEAGKLDDLVVKFLDKKEEKWAFLQAKYSSSNTILHFDEFYDSKRKTKFGFPQYFYSAVKILNSRKCKVSSFVLHTNRRLDEKLQAHFKPEKDSILYKLLKVQESKYNKPGESKASGVVNKFRFDLPKTETDGVKKCINQYLLSQIVRQINKDIGKQLIGANLEEHLKSACPPASLDYDKLVEIFKNNGITYCRLEEVIRDVVLEVMGINPEEPLDSLAHFNSVLSSFRLSCEYPDLKNLKSSNCKLLSSLRRTLQTARGLDVLHNHLMFSMIEWWNEQQPDEPCKLLDAGWITSKLESFIAWFQSSKDRI